MPMSHTEYAVQIITDDTPIQPSDRAFNYGDGVFTTLCIENSQPQLLSFHINRLIYDASAIGITLDETALEQAIVDFATKQVLNNVSTQSKCTKQVLKVHVSAGIGGRGYARDDENVPQVRFSFHPYPVHYAALAEQGMALICAETALAIQPLLAGVKHMNRLEQVLIKREIKASGADDAIVCDTQDHVVESSIGNVFFYANGTWYTPSLKGSGVNGVVRQCLIQALLNDNQALNVGEYELSALAKAECVVVTNALMGVMPVNAITFPDARIVRYKVDSEPQRELARHLRKYL